MHVTAFSFHYGWTIFLFTQEIADSKLNNKSEFLGCKVYDYLNYEKILIAFIHLGDANSGL